MLEARSQRPLGGDVAWLHDQGGIIGIVQCEVLRRSRTHRLATTQQVLGHRQRAVNVLGRERLHQAAECNVGHRKARRLAADEQAWNAKLVEADGDWKAGGAASKME